MDFSFKQVAGAVIVAVILGILVAAAVTYSNNNVKQMNETTTKAWNSNGSN